MDSSINAGTILLIAAVSGLIFGFLSAWIAKGKGRDPVSYFFLGFLLGIIGLIIAAVVSPADPSTPRGRQSARAWAVVGSPTGPRIDPGELSLTDTGIVFMEKNRAYQVPIGFSEITSATVKSKQTLGQEVPLRSELLKGNRRVLEVWKGQQPYYFSGDGRALSSILARLLTPMQQAQQYAQQMAQLKKCPYCAEMIQIEAVKCRYCGADLVVQV